MSAKYDQLIYNTAIKQGFKPVAAKLIVAQARFESADYTSNVFKANNNTSGMKFIGQPLATRGSLAPKNERSKTCQAGGACINSDHYAKFANVQDSATDKIVRLYSITKGGVSPEQLKNVKGADEFASLLKKRGYYGDKESIYASGLKAKLLRIQVVEFVTKNKNTLLLGAGLILLASAYYVYNNKLK
jgi:uncharacterized FlgJ-related protein